MRCRCLLEPANEWLSTRPIPSLISVTHPCLQRGLDGKGHYRQTQQLEKVETGDLCAPSCLSREGGNQGSEDRPSPQLDHLDEDGDVKKPLERETHRLLCEGHSLPLAEGSTQQGLGIIKGIQLQSQALQGSLKGQF